MASANFIRLADSIRELKRIYLDNALTLPAPSPDHQEQARAFVTFAHAELEYYVEESLRDLAGVTLSSAAAGTFGHASMALLAFGGLAAMKGGTTLSTGTRKIPRRLATRFGEAHGLLIRALDGNNGVREKHIAAMAIPLGLDAGSIDNTWLNDLDAFCSSRGAFAHMSRTSQRGSHLAVNPHDEWTKCERLVWTNAAFPNPNMITSFESFDLWVEMEKTAFGTIVTPPWRVKILHVMMQVISGLRRRDAAANEDD